MMYKHCALVVAAILLVAADPNANNEQVKQESARLERRWLAESQEYGGEQHPADKDSQSWHFMGNQLTRFVDSQKLDVVQFEINPAENPGHLDLVPIKDENKGEKPGVPGGLLARTKGIYSLQDDQLKVAFTFEFLPMTPEQEKQQAIRWAGIRPKSFDTMKGDVAVVTFKRAKKKAP